MGLQLLPIGETDFSYSEGHLYGIMSPIIEENEYVEDPKHAKKVATQDVPKRSGNKDQKSQVSNESKEGKDSTFEKTSYKQ